MARIRTIKPELPHSESMGAVSRDARLTFILLWTVADDEGRLRGDSRLLASLLFPYDSDARALLPGWLAELEREQCLAIYAKENHTYIQITNWTSHQKIDRPSSSKFPPFDESSRVLANNREPSSLDQGEDQRNNDQRIKDRGLDEPSRGLASVREETQEVKDKPKKFVKPSLEEVHAYMESLGSSMWFTEGRKFHDFYESKGWKVGREGMKDWKAAARGWLSRATERVGGKTSGGGGSIAQAQRVLEQIRQEAGF